MDFDALQFPVDMTPELTRALHAVVGQLQKHVAATGPIEGDAAALDAAQRLLREVADCG